MRASLLSIALLVTTVAASTVSPAQNGSRYGFYRWMGRRGGGGGAGTRRVFGGAAAPLSTFGAACALFDRYWTPRCSGAVLAPRWALTAAHCVSPRIAYVKYNARRPVSAEGDVAPVHYLYRHPGYNVVQEDEGRGMDVTLLHHDVGLVRTRRDMVLHAKPPVDPLRAMRLYDPHDIRNEEVQVLGFGRTEESSLGEELFEVRLRLVFCERGAWMHCVCGVTAGAARAGEAAGEAADAAAGAGGGAGVCSGDSGGPVLYRGAQVAVTSMGPLECATLRASPPAAATSVFTSLYNYADVVNATIYDTEAALRMSMIGGAREHEHASAALLLALALAAAALSTERVVACLHGST